MDKPKLELQPHEDLEQFLEQFNGLKQGQVGLVILKPGGNLGGLDYGPEALEFVILDEDTDEGRDVAVRYTDDEIDEGWEVFDLWGLHWETQSWLRAIADLDQEEEDSA